MNFLNFRLWNILNFEVLNLSLNAFENIPICCFWSGFKIVIYFSLPKRRNIWNFIHFSKFKQNFCNYWIYIEIFKTSITSFFRIRIGSRIVSVNFKFINNKLLFIMNLFVKSFRNCWIFRIPWLRGHISLINTITHTSDVPVKALLIAKLLSTTWHTANIRETSLDAVIVPYMTNHSVKE